MTVTARTIQCTTCRGSGKTESDDSTDDRIYKCWACDGTGKIADRRKPDPALAGAVEALREWLAADDAAEADFNDQAEARLDAAIARARVIVGGW